MNRLFDSLGRHIANELNGHLYSPRGDNIGHYVQSAQIFIDMSGSYLGEIIFGNRLVYNRSSPHRSSNYGSYGNYGNIGNYGNPGNFGSIGLPGGYENIDDG
jgi:hypothetical protein